MLIINIFIRMLTRETKYGKILYDNICVLIAVSCEMSGIDNKK